MLQHDVREIDFPLLLAAQVAETEGTEAHVVPAFDRFQQVARDECLGPASRVPDGRPVPQIPLGLLAQRPRDVVSRSSVVVLDVHVRRAVLIPSEGDAVVGRQAHDAAAGPSAFGSPARWSPGSTPDRPRSSGSGRSRTGSPAARRTMRYGPCRATSRRTARWHASRSSCPAQVVFGEPVSQRRGEQIRLVLRPRLIGFVHAPSRSATWSEHSS